ncbi:MAG: glycosyltransferase [Candidatus Gastranaerophilales bacterium]|nr:glycosyltransferase [Candidatus Gastranaerophilales bacterium]
MKISFITASYNYQDYIAETINSVIAQTYEDWELIIVDDGSKDNSVNLIKEFCAKNPKIKLFTHQNNENKGLVETIKLGLSKAQGEFVAFLESDDYIAPDYIEKKLAVLNQYPDVKFIFNDIEMFGNQEKINEMKKYFEKLYGVFDKVTEPVRIYKYFFFYNFVPTFSCVMVNRNVLMECNFDSPIKAWVDWWLWAQISFENDFYFLKEKLTFWRMHQTSYINRAAKTVDDNQQMFFRELLKFLKPVDFPYYLLVAIIKTRRIEKIFRGLLNKILAMNILVVYDKKPKTE